MSFAAERDLVPALRSDVRVESRPDTPEFPAAIVDPTLEQKVKLDRLGSRVAPQLDRPQPLDELLGRLAGDGAATAALGEQVVELLDGLGRLFLLDDDRAARALEERRQMDAWLDASAEEIPFVTLPGARFECTGCGGCCGGHNIGPVDPRVQEMLASDEGRRFLDDASLGDREIYVRRVADLGGDEEGVVALRTEGGFCVFLGEDSRCRMHARFGGPSKPSVCQLFPYSFVLRPDGVAVGLQMECRDVLAASEVGPPLAEQRSALNRLLRMPQQIQRVRPAVVVDGLATLPYAAYARLRDAMIDALSGEVQDPILALAELRRILDAGCEGEELGERSRVARLDAVSELRRAFHELVQQLGGRFVRLRHELANDEADRVVRLDSLDATIGGLSRLVPELERVLRAPRDPGAMQLFRMLAQNALIGEEVASAASLRHGLTVLALRWVLARAVAVDRAHVAKRPEPNAQDHIDGLAAVSFEFRGPRVGRILRDLASPLSLIFFDHLTDIAANAPALAVPDRRVEIFLS